MGNKEKKIAYILLFLMVLKASLTYSKYLQIPGIISNVIDFSTCAYVLLILVSIKNISKSKLLFFTIISILILYTGIVTKSLVIFSSFLIFILTCFLDKENVVKIIFYTLVSVLIIQFILYLIDYNSTIVKMVRDEGGRTRHYLGFDHPNISGIFAFWALSAFTYLNRNKILKIFLGECFLLIVYYFNQSRTMLYCSIILMLLYILANLKMFDKLIRWLSKYILIMIMLFIFAIIPMYNNKNAVASKINDISSGRIHYIAKAINTFGITFAGRYADDAANGIITDVTYSALIYRYGIIYILLLFLIANYISNNGSVYEQILIITWFIFAFFEVYSLNFAIAFPMLFANKWIIEKEIKNDT